ncbi:MAG TPA: DUF58 domain-containing protein, partial [Ktedonobacteraceae bacterium]
MDTDRFYDRTLGEESLVRRRPWYVLALLLFLLGAIVHQPVAFLISLFALVIGIVPDIWSRFALRHLRLQQEVSQRRAFFGETITLSIRLENQKLLPLPWVETESEIPERLPVLAARVSPTYKALRVALINAFSLWSFQRVTRRYRVRCLARGRYTFGPVTVRWSDPFGWLVREERLAVYETVFVYPIVASLEIFGLSSRHPFGARVTPQALLEDPLLVAGTREYHLGDDPRRIHWKASAHAGELRSKVYEPSSQYRLLVALDIRSYKTSWLGVDPELQELTISVAASLAMWGLDAGYSVGLLVNSVPGSSSGENRGDSGTPAASIIPSFTPAVSLPLARSQQQRERVLSVLGQLVPYFSTSIHTLMEEARRSLPMGTTVVLVSAAQALQEETIACLLDMRLHGAAVHIVATGDEPNQVHEEMSGISVHYAGGREKWHELVETVDFA